MLHVQHALLSLLCVVLCNNTAKSPYLRVWPQREPTKINISFPNPTFRTLCLHCKTYTKGNSNYFGFQMRCSAALLLPTPFTRHLPNWIIDVTFIRRITFSFRESSLQFEKSEATTNWATWTTKATNNTWIFLATPRNEKNHAACTCNSYLTTVTPICRSLPKRQREIFYSLAFNSKTFFSKRLKDTTGVTMYNRWWIRGIN